MSAPSAHLEDFYVHKKGSPICRLECDTAFQGLSDKEKMYTHWMSKAAWAGAPAVLAQVSEESPRIFQLFQTLFSKLSVNELNNKAKDIGVPEESFTHFLNYVGEFYGNLGNYRSFGDTKFIPRTSKEDFDKIISVVGDQEVTNLWNEVRSFVFSLEENERELGLPPNGKTTYYKGDISMDEIQKVNDLLTSGKAEVVVTPWNTRLFKTGENTFELRVACSVERDGAVVKGDGFTVQIKYGDFKQEMANVVDAMKKAKQYAANELQEQMIDRYIEHFEQGHVEIHMDAQRVWIKDIGPAVETNIGFIETYRDPFGVRAEWEGFVAVVNREMSRKFSLLVSRAEELLPLLPWPSDFEKSKFQKPDFTSLDVVSFSSSGIPAGINIPNYDEVRQNEGFKNVSLGNVISSEAPQVEITFLNDKDRELYRELKAKAFEVQVGLHELLGHGSGKLLSEDKEGKFNFPEGLTNPVTGKPVTKWYKPGEEYTAKFAEIGSSMEECRAECVGIYLCIEKSVMDIFGFQDDKAEDIIYVNWLIMARAGLLALEFFSPKTEKWGQAHMQARYAIFRVLLDAGVVSLVGEGENLQINLARGDIKTAGRQAIGEFLTKLNVFKATGDYESAKELYAHYTGVTPEHLKLRDIVLAKKQPRKVFVQANTKISGDQVELVTYAADHQGMVNSFVERF